MLYAKGTMHPPCYISIVTYIGVFYYITIGGAYIINESRRVARLDVQSVTFSWKRMKERRGGVTKS